MFQMLIQVVFTIVSSIMDIIMTPFINMIVALFPDSQQYYVAFSAFLAYAFTYLATILRWFLFTVPMFDLLFGYFAIKFSIWAIACTVRAGINFYNVLKP